MVLVSVENSTDFFILSYAHEAMAFLGELLAADPDLQDPIFFARRRIVASLMKTLSEDTMIFRECSTVGYYEAF